MEYQILTTTDFERKYSVITKRNQYLKEKYRFAMKSMEIDPRTESLRTHKVNSPTYGKVYSSRVTGDIRILWNYFGPQKVIILLLTTGKHSGGFSVYR